MKRMEICGNIATGKTTLATLLEKEGWRVVYERMEQNPFLSDFYATHGDSGLNYDFETECTCFLMHHAWIKAGTALAEGERKALACDFSLLQDYSYGKANLAPADMGAFESIFRHCTSRLSKPDLLVYLTCDSKKLLDRIRLRGRPDEQSIDEAYLGRLGNALAAEVQKFPEVLVIDTGAVDLLGEGSLETLEEIKRRLAGV